MVDGDLLSPDIQGWQLGSCLRSHSGYHTNQLRLAS